MPIENNDLSPQLSLSFNLEFNELYDTAGLSKVDAAFLKYLRNQNANLADHLEASREDAPNDKDEAEILIEIGHIWKISSLSCSA
jgi:hypothetical protein